MNPIEPDYLKDNAITIADTFPDPIAILDTKGIILWCNAATFHATQLAPEEILGQRFTRLTSFKTSEIPKYVRIFASVLTGKDIEPIETLWNRKDGTSYLSEVRLRRITLSNGKNAILVITRDISKTKLAEITAGEDEEKAKQYLDIAHVIIVALDTNGNITSINKYGCEILGVTSTEVLGKNWFDKFIPNMQREKTKTAFQSLLRGDLKIENYKSSVLLNDNTERIFLWYNTAIRNHDEIIIGTLSTGEDITEFVQVEHALRKSEEKHRLFFENAQVPLFRTDLQSGLIIGCNLMGAQLFGYDRTEELEGKLTVSDMYMNRSDRR
ncbi:MAG: PAS domain S-box protein, partial [Candidatus Thorarchaeota archaeon]